MVAHEQAYAYQNRLTKETIRIDIPMLGGVENELQLCHTSHLRNSCTIILKINAKWCADNVISPKHFEFIYISHLFHRSHSGLSIEILFRIYAAYK